MREHMPQRHILLAVLSKLRPKAGDFVFESGMTAFDLLEQSHRHHRFGTGKERKARFTFHGFGSIADAKLAEEVGDVGSDRAPANKKRFTNFRVSAAGRQEAQHL